jgi:hypothetical protein
MILKTYLTEMKETRDLRMSIKDRMHDWVSNFNNHLRDRFDVFRQEAAQSSPG